MSGPTGAREEHFSYCTFQLLKRLPAQHLQSCNVCNITAAPASSVRARMQDDDFVEEVPIHDEPVPTEQPSHPVSVSSDSGVVAMLFVVIWWPRLDFLPALAGALPGRQAVSPAWRCQHSAG